MSVVGIGKVLALDIAQRGATVHLVCRNETRGRQAKEEIQQITNNDVKNLCSTITFQRRPRIFALSAMTSKVHLLPQLPSDECAHHKLP